MPSDIIPTEMFESEPSFININPAQDSSFYVRAARSGSDRPRKVKVYLSGGCGTYIRDAITGTLYTSLVGSADEDLFFTVSVSTGEAPARGNKLFFSSPMEYLSHIGEPASSMPQEVFCRWFTKRYNRTRGKNDAAIQNKN
jgi:hypothetical protein